MTDNTKTQGVVIHVHHFPESTLARMSLACDLGFGFMAGAATFVAVAKLIWWIGKALFA